MHIRGPHVPRDLSSLLRDCRHVPDESQVSSEQQSRFSSTSLHFFSLNLLIYHLRFFQSDGRSFVADNGPTGCSGRQPGIRLSHRFSLRGSHHIVRRVSVR